MYASGLSVDWTQGELDRIAKIKHDPARDPEKVKRQKVRNDRKLAIMLLKKITKQKAKKDRRRAIILLMDSGVKLKDIYAIFGLSQRCVYNILKEVR